MANILVVDDSETLRSQLRKTLESKEHQVVEAEDGLSGIKQFRVHKELQLILCDVNMPEMDGLTMCEKIKAEFQDRKVPIFMLTTESSQDMKVRGKAAGVMAWITKPFIDNKLLSAIDKVTGTGA